MECRNNMIEHTHFERKKVEKVLKSLSAREIWLFQSEVIVHNLDCFDSYFRVVLSRGNFVIVFQLPTAVRKAHYQNGY